LNPVSLATFQNSLQPDEMLLEYVLAESESYCLQITRAGIKIWTIPSGRRYIEELIDRYLAIVRSKEPEADIGRELFSILLERSLGLESKYRIIVVPDGKLHLLPFDALRDKQGRYVLETHVVSYAPSATVLHLIRSHPSGQTSKKFLGVGGVVYTK